MAPHEIQGIIQNNKFDSEGKAKLILQHIKREQRTIHKHWSACTLSFALLYMGWHCLLIGTYSKQEVVACSPPNYDSIIETTKDSVMGWVVQTINYIPTNPVDKNGMIRVLLHPIEKY